VRGWPAENGGGGGDGDGDSDGDGGGDGGGDDAVLTRVVVMLLLLLTRSADRHLPRRNGVTPGLGRFPVHQPRGAGPRAPLPSSSTYMVRTKTPQREHRIHHDRPPFHLSSPVLQLDLHRRPHLQQNLLATIGWLHQLAFHDLCRPRCAVGLLASLCYARYCKAVTTSTVGHPLEAKARLRGHRKPCLELSPQQVKHPSDNSAARSAFAETHASRFSQADGRTGQRPAAVGYNCLATEHT
jgi:hypothetical protein